MIRCQKRLVLLPCLFLLVVSCAHDELAPDTLTGLENPGGESFNDLEKTTVGDSGYCNTDFHNRIEEVLNNDENIVFMTFQKTIAWSTGGVIDATPPDWPAGYEIKMVIPAECVPPTYPGYESVQFGVAVPADGPGPGITSVPFHFYPDGVDFQHQPELILAWPPWAGTPSSPVISLINIQTEIHDGAVHYRLPDALSTMPSALAAGTTAPVDGWTAEELSTGVEFHMPHFSRWDLVDDEITGDDGTDTIFFASGLVADRSCWTKYEPEIPDLLDPVAFIQ